MNEKDREVLKNIMYNATLKNVSNYKMNEHLYLYILQESWMYIIAVDTESQLLQ